MEDADVCPKCGGHHVHQDEDVLDTWFSSQLVDLRHAGLARQHRAARRAIIPRRRLFTARDIIALWVARMIMASTYFLDEIPFHDVVIYATILAKDGSRMSKSKGNGVDPMDLIEKYGADAMRFNLLTLVTNNQDVRFDADIDQEDPRAHFYSPRTEQARAFVTKIWNASRFVLGNLEGFTPGRARGARRRRMRGSCQPPGRPVRASSRRGFPHTSSARWRSELHDVLLERVLRLVHRVLEGEPAR